VPAVMKRGGGGEAKFFPPKDNIRLHGGETFGAGPVQRFFNHPQCNLIGKRFFLCGDAVAAIYDDSVILNTIYSITSLYFTHENVNKKNINQPVRWYS
jgi:hypothetical protein